jgi:hypothetical protein
MGCREGPDPADGQPGSVPDPDGDPITPQISVLDPATVSVRDGATQIQLAIILSHANHDDTVTVQWDTANGTALAGTHYTARTGQTASFSPGETEKTISVPVNDTGGASGTYYFTVNLSSPTNATIYDSQAAAGIFYGSGGTPPPSDLPSSFRKWPRSNVVFNENDDCAYFAASASSAGATAVAGLLYLHRGRNIATGNNSLNWKKMHRNAGGCTICCGSQPSGCSSSCTGTSAPRILSFLAGEGSGDGIQEAASNDFHKALYQEIDKSAGWASVVDKIKRAIKDTGIVYMVSPWYGPAGEGWNRARACSDFVLRNPNANGPYGLNDSTIAERCLTNDSPCCNWTAGNLVKASTGHAWVITGWNDNYKRTGGAFEVQAAFGIGWGDNGRAWMPYSYLQTDLATNEWAFYKMTYRTNDIPMERVITRARDYVDANTSYDFGTEGQPGTCVDCSGLIHRIFTDTGYQSLVYGGRTTAQGYTNRFKNNNRFTQDITKRKRGDLISYYKAADNRVTHIGIYLGDDRVISATCSANCMSGCGGTPGVIIHGYNIAGLTEWVCKPEYPNNDNFTADAVTLDAVDTEEQVAPAPDASQTE